MQYDDDFSKWLEKYLAKGLPSNVVAINFNLYEGDEATYDIQLIGAETFDESDDDWACDEVFSTEEDVFLIPRTAEIAEWEDGLALITKMIETYLHEGKYAERLKQYQAVGVGFIDGEITILHKK